MKDGQLFFNDSKQPILFIEYRLLEACHRWLSDGKLMDICLLRAVLCFNKQTYFQPRWSQPSIGLCAHLKMRKTCGAISQSISQNILYILFCNRLINYLLFEHSCLTLVLSFVIFFWIVHFMPSFSSVLIWRQNTMGLFHFCSITLNIYTFLNFDCSRHAFYDSGPGRFWNP